jgi:hypothetical protein
MFPFAKIEAGNVSPLKLLRVIKVDGSGRQARLSNSPSLA